MLPSGARFLALDELDPSTQFCADPEVHFRMLLKKKHAHALARVLSVLSINLITEREVNPFHVCTQFLLD